MTNEMTVSKLNEMRLTAMSETFRTQLTNSKLQELSFEERFGIIVDIEWARRKSNRLSKLIKSAGFKFNQACIEDIE